MITELIAMRFRIADIKQCKVASVFGQSVVSYLRL